MDIKRLFKRRGALINLYTWLFATCLIGIMCGVGLTMSAIVYKNKSFIISFAVFTAVCAIVFCVFLLLYKKHGYGKSPLQAYEFDFECNSAIEVLKRFSESLTLHTLPKAVCCSRTQQGKYYIHWFFYYLPQFDLSEFKKLEKVSALSAVEAGVIPAKMSRDIYLRSGRCNVIISEGVDEKLSAFIHENADKRICQTEGIVDCIVDLSENKVYIPALWGGFSGQLKKYRILVREFIKLTKTG